jgi:hypothetical protein
MGRNSRQSGRPGGKMGQGAKRQPPGVDPGAGVATGAHEDLRERLQNLRTIVPVLAHETVNARREAARLRVENQKLLEEVRRLQRKRTGRRSTVRMNPPPVLARERRDLGLAAARKGQPLAM